MKFAYTDSFNFIKIKKYIRWSIRRINMKDKKVKKITSIMASTVVVLLLGGIWIDSYYSKMERKNYQLENTNSFVAEELNEDSGDLYVAAKKVLEDGFVSEEKLEYIIAEVKLVNEKLFFLNGNDRILFYTVPYGEISNKSYFEAKDNVYYLNGKTKEVFQDIVECTEIISNWKAPNNMREKNLYTDNIEKQWKDSIDELTSSLNQWKDTTNSH